MADAVATNTIKGGAYAKRMIVHLTNLSDGTGESAVVKVDRSALTLPNGSSPNKINIRAIRWAIQGFTYIKLSWDHTADDTAFLLSGNGYDCFETYGVLSDPNTSVDAVTGAIGDLLLTTAGAASGATYDITLELDLS